jgi:hypothetical protein
MDSRESAAAWLHGRVDEPLLPGLNIGHRKPMKVARAIVTGWVVLLTLVSFAPPAQARKYWDADDVPRNHVRVKPNLVTIKESWDFSVSRGGIPLTIVGHCNVHYTVRRWVNDPVTGAIAFRKSYRAGEKLKMVKPSGERRSTSEWVVVRIKTDPFQRPFHWTANYVLNCRIRPV